VESRLDVEFQSGAAWDLAGEWEWGAESGLGVESGSGAALVWVAASG
jgi:hypothetical protein